MTFSLLSEEWVAQAPPGGPVGAAVGSRCAVANNDEVICTFMFQSRLGVNDFVPMRVFSKDGGITWTEPELIWPTLREKWSLYCSISRAPSGELFLYGIRTPIDMTGESFWSEATLGMKQNELFWACSLDGGRTWSGPNSVPMATPGSAEAPGPLWAGRGGRWLVCYAPSPTFDPTLAVDQRQIVLLYSDDRGRSWKNTSMLRFADPNCIGCQAWVIELADGRLLGTCWQVSLDPCKEYATPYAVSRDAGVTWRQSSTGIRGQSTGLAPLPDGRALLVYNQRKHGDVGVWMATLRLEGDALFVESNEIVWRAAKATLHESSGELVEWTDFAFGEPSVTLLPDGTALVTLWCIQPSGVGIRYVKVKYA